MSAGVANRTRFAVLPPAFAPQPIRIQRWWTWPTMISLVAGLLTNIRFQFGGKASVGEIVLAVVALFAVLANLGNPRFWSRRMLVILCVLCVSFSGYIVSDLINATPPDKLVRGWARMAFVISDFIAIWALARNSTANLFAVCVGDALSTLLSYGDEYRDFLYNYKFHFALPITVLVMIAVPLLRRRQAHMATGIALIGLGMCHLWLDFRTAGAICILIGFVLVARGITASRLRSLYLTLLALALIVSSLAVVYLYSATNVTFADRREGSNSARIGRALAGISAIERSPVFGLGSWVWDTGMWNVYAGEMGRGIGDSTIEDTLDPHSQLIQAWAEAGVLGLVFFFYFGKLLIEALWALLNRSVLNTITPLCMLFLLDALWDLGFSPFANLHRLNIALALFITIYVLREKDRVRVS